MGMIKVAAPWTGGCDTTFLVWQLASCGYEVFTYHVDYGNMNHPAEIWAIKHIYDKLHDAVWNIGTVHLPVEMMYYIPNVRSMWMSGTNSDIHTKNVPNTPTDINEISRCSWDIPFRNGILFSMGVSFAEGIDVDTLMLQIESDAETMPGSEYRDDSMAFVDAINQMCKVGSFVHIECPISDRDVAERYRFAYDLNIHPFVNVGRCNYPRWLDGAYHPCGKCITCESSKFILRRDYGTDEFWGICHED